MNTNPRRSLKLPKTFAPVTLPRRLDKVLSHVIKSGDTGISTLELTAAGCFDPTRSISDIRSLGGLISSELRHAEDFLGETHPQVAHYKYCGWRVTVSQLLAN
ncbi:MAG: hypothetical protein ACJAW7_001110 [Candidatus Azotimanducaceae bacterium]|jgi:hypothetical protein